MGSAGHKDHSMLILSQQQKTRQPWRTRHDFTYHLEKNLLCKIQPILKAFCLMGHSWLAWGWISDSYRWFLSVQMWGTGTLSEWPFDYFAFCFYLLGCPEYQYPSSIWEISHLIKCGRRHKPLPLQSRKVSHTCSPSPLCSQGTNVSLRLNQSEMPALDYELETTDAQL